MARRSQRRGNFGFYGGVAGGGIGFLVPAMTGATEFAGLLRLGYGILGLVLGMGLGLLIARLTRR